jgi:DnaK suppressor protein
MTIRENTDAELTRSQLERLKDLLLDKRRELHDTLDVLNRQIVAKEDCSLTDVVEAASQREVVSRASGLADMHNQTVAEIDHALSRLEKGCYGISEESGEPIAYERLLVIPWTRKGLSD